jgi:GNAT superfamily N-acetyltransferase
MNKIDLITKAANASDFDFCWGIYSDSVREAMTPLIPSGWKADAEKANFKSIWVAAESHLILYDDTAIGWMAIKELTDRLVIEHLYVRKSHQRKGIGTILVDFVAKKAAEKGKSVTASVLKPTTAISFAEKRRFSRTGETPISFEVQRRD